MGLIIENDFSMKIVRYAALLLKNFYYFHMVLNIISIHSDMTKQTK